MIKKHEANPLIKPESIKPSRDGYRVKGAFNAGAAEYNDEITSVFATFEIRDMAQLTQLLSKIQGVRGVISTSRRNQATVIYSS